MENGKEKTRISYIGPEIPALAATFVYNEILALEKEGFEVLPLSVHVPETWAKDPEVEDLKSRTVYLYAKSFPSLMGASILYFLKNPLRYMAALFMALGDACRGGIGLHVRLGLLYRFIVAATVADLLERKGCRLIHAHFAHVSTDIAMYASRLSGIPFTFTSHANDLFERGWLLKEKVLRSAAAVTISEFNRRFLRAKGADDGKVVIVRCGVSTDRIEYAPPAGETKDTPRVGTIGRLVEKKGFDVLLEALAILQGKGFSFRLEIAGGGPLMEELQEKAKQEGLSDRVSFVGPVAHNKVFDWLRSLALFVLACRKDRHGDQDGIPVVLMEAMAMGVPVISTRISGIPELIEDGVSGLLAVPDDPVTLAEKIGEFLTHPGKGAEMAEAALKRVREEFDVNVNTTRLRRLFLGVIHGR